jgi:hypothetical protein
MARMMDTLILDPFVPSSSIGVSKLSGMSKSVNQLSSAGQRTTNNRPVGPVRPAVRQNINSINRSSPRNPYNNNNNNNGDEFMRGGEWRSETQRCEDTWKASLRKRDPEIQPSLPNIPTRSRFANLINFN